MPRKVWLVVLSVLLCAPLARAESTLVIPQQGRLLDGSEQPVEGSLEMTFRIWSAFQAAPGEQESPLWTSDVADVKVTGGLYAVNLGEATPLPASLFPAGADRWLSVTIGGTELLPRLRIGAVAHALAADDAAHAAHADVADEATRADEADHAAAADEADHAAAADEADHAAAADEADHAAAADEADHAAAADDASHLEGLALADLDARYARVAGGGLDVTGSVSAGSFTGDGSGLANLTASNVAGELGTDVTYAGQPIADPYIASAATWNAKVSPDDPRLTDARDPKPGSASYVWNGTTPQPGDFDLAGSGTLGGDLSLGGLLRLGDPTTCDGAAEGGLRYEPARHRVEVCDGTRWLPLGANFASCRTILESGASSGDGDYRLASGALVTCDMTTDGGGWTKLTGSLLQAENWMSFDAVNHPPTRTPTGTWFEGDFIADGTFILDPLTGTGCADDITIRATARLPFTFGEYRGSWTGSGRVAASNHDDNDPAATWGSRNGVCNGHLMFGTDTDVAKPPGTYGTDWNANGATKTFTWSATRITPTTELRWEVEDQGANEDIVFSQIVIWVR